MPYRFFSMTTRTIYAGTFVGLALVASLSVAIYRSAVDAAIEERAAQQQTLVRTAAVGLNGELLALSARISQFNSIPSTQYLDVPYMAPRVNAAFSDDPHGVVQAIVRIDAGGLMYAWDPTGLLTVNGQTVVIDRDEWTSLVDPAVRGRVVVAPVWWSGDAAPQWRALLMPVWRFAPSDVYPIPRNDFNGLVAIVIDLARVADVYLGPALADLSSDDIVVGVGVDDLGLLMNPSTPEVRVSRNDAHAHATPYGTEVLEDAGGRRLHSWATFTATGQRWTVAASSSYGAAAAGFQRSAMGQLLLTATLLIAVPVTGWWLARRERLAQNEQRRLERQLAGAQRMEAIGKLAGGVAHDFNNMLTAILGYASLLYEDAPDGSPVREQAAQIRRAAENAAALTQKLLAFSRRQVLQANQFDFALMVDRLTAIIQGTAPDGAEVVFDVEPGLWPILADPDQIEQSIVNLAENAREAMPAGGVVRIQAANVPLPGGGRRADVEIAPGDYVALTVIDAGRGMDESTRARMFEPFFTTKRAGAGSGLGLSMVYGYVKQSGGYVTVQSAPGRGTSVELLLPRAKAPTPTAPMTPPALVSPAPPASVETVLVAEDEEAVREVAVTLLKRQGYRVLVAAGGDEALRLAREFPEPIHLLLTDVVMPGMKGPELARRLKADRPATRVLLMSGYAADVVTGEDLKGMPLISKPFSPLALARAVRAALGQSPLPPPPPPTA